MDWKSALIGIIVLVVAVSVAGIFLGGGETTPIDTGSSPNEPAVVTLFYEDFSGEFPGENWVSQAAPEILSMDNDPVLNCSYCYVKTAHTFSNSNGMKLSVDVFLPSSSNDLYIYLEDEHMLEMNFAELHFVSYYNKINYWMHSQCISSPEVKTLDAPFDNQWHNFVFISNTDGTATWSIDGAVVMENSNFMPGDYGVKITGYKCIPGNDCREVLVDNIELDSLGETSQDISCNVGGGGGGFKNPCGAGYCWSNGACCPSSAQYYCSATNKCYSSRNSAMSASGSRCSDFRIVC